jgi:hypothetical protein
LASPPPPQANRLTMMNDTLTIEYFTTLQVRAEE